jgi:c-di-GMP-binding flagellar brake protein YcgR
MGGMKVPMSIIEIVERRRHKRFQAEGGAYAAIRPQYDKIGQIIDVSKGGLAFRYLVSGSHESESFEMDIFLIGDGFHLDKVPFKTVFDQEIPKSLCPGPQTMRRCGVKFGELTQTQAHKLENFILKHTIDKTEC